MTPWLVLLLSLVTQACVASVADLADHDLGAACITPSCLAVTPKVQKLCNEYADALEERVAFCDVDFPDWARIRADWRKRTCENPRVRTTSSLTESCLTRMAEASCVTFTVVLRECDQLWYFAPFI